jgi:hypothetical protein
LPWRADVTLPKESEGVVWSDEIQFIRNVRSAEIWMVRNWNDPKSSQSGYKIYIYGTDNKTWSEISNLAGEGSGKFFGLYLGKDESVWATGSSQSGRIFGKFNENSGKFELLKVSQTIPDGHIFFGEGVFWIFVEGGAIYSFDPETLDIERRAFVPYLVVDNSKGIVFAPDGSIYFMHQLYETGSFSIDNLALYHFMPHNNDVERVYNIPLQDLGPFDSLFLDREMNLWLSDYGWMKPNGSWYQIVRSPVFITDKIPEHSSLSWEHPSIVLESSNRYLWFQSSNGMVSLDPKKGEWCWFTTYQSNIVEDPQHNLWMIADNKLYKYSLGSK